MPIEETGIIIQQPQQQEEARSTAARTKRPAPKYTWLITHGSAGPRITAELLKDKGNLIADECHSTIEQATAYTYVHLKKKARLTSLEKFMNTVRELGIEKIEIRGFDCAAPVHTHAVFKMLEKHIRDKNPAFNSHTDGRDELTRGSLFRAVADVMPPQARKRRRTDAEQDPMQRFSKKQLVAMASTLTTERMLADAEKDQMRAEIEKLKTDNAAITERLERLHEEGEGYV
jgi:molecular chaperone GrpE (heat shock protein)